MLISVLDDILSATICPWSSLAVSEVEEDAERWML